MGGPFRLGLTGGIGSGKSTVANCLRELGAAIIDADAISRSVTAPGGAAIKPLAAAFGEGFINAEGALDRDKMRALAYADTSARRRLETIVHPLVGQETARQAEEAAASGHPCIVFDIPLLVESQRWRQTVHQVLVVDCTPAVQIARVMARSGLERIAIEKIIASQASRAVRLRAADVVIFNDQIGLEQLAKEVAQAGRWFGLSSL
jgi:dephospho-CoA kinase